MTATSARMQPNNLAEVSMSKTLKLVGTKNFTVELVELDSGMYCVRHEVDEKMHFSEKITDYNIASYMFDLKLQELEGN